MSTAISIKQTEALANIESVLIGGDLSKLGAPDRVIYYKRVCETLDLNPLTKPFDYITLNGKLVLYATKGCGEQLRANKKVSITIPAREVIEDVYVVTAEASLPDGRKDSATGAVSIAGLKGENRANAMMKAETKAKRRVTLSICGLNMLDETEVETIREQEKRIVPQKPEEGDGVIDNRVYLIGYGKWAGRTLDEVCRMPSAGPKELARYVTWLEDEKSKEGPLKDTALELIAQATKFLGEIENT